MPTNLNVRLDPKLYARINFAAHARRMTMSEFVRSVAGREAERLLKAAARRAKERRAHASGMQNT